MRSRSNKGVVTGRSAVLFGLLLYLSRHSDGQSSGGDVFGDYRACPGYSLGAHGNRGDEHGVAPDERAVFDDRTVFVPSVEVTGDRTCPHVHFGADGGVAHVAEVAHQRPR